mmetsp:Transcript_15480/g.25526  ORF Transcript_15480/g.25526 Transcript_15480/m.25526 type:complete len:89 (-) Transcript_15480:661-927(-)
MSCGFGLLASPPFKLEGRVHLSRVMSQVHFSVCTHLSAAVASSFPSSPFSSSPHVPSTPLHSPPVPSPCLLGLTALQSSSNSSKVQRL